MLQLFRQAAAAAAAAAPAPGRLQPPQPQPRRREASSGKAQRVADVVAVELTIDDEDDTVDADFYVAARRKLAAIEAGQTTLDAFIANFEALNGMDYANIPGEAEVDRMARAYFINDKRIRAAATASL